MSLGYLVCVDTDGHLKQIPSQTWHTVEMILAEFHPSAFALIDLSAYHSMYQGKRHFFSIVSKTEAI